MPVWPKIIVFIGRKNTFVKTVLWLTCTAYVCKDQYMAATRVVAQVQSENQNELPPLYSDVVETVKK